MMTHQYNVTGMTCSGCEAKVKSSFLKLPDVLSAEVSKDNGSATIDMQNHIGLPALQEALGGKSSKYQISATPQSEMQTATTSFFATYKPVLLLFAYIAVAAGIASWQNQSNNWMLFIRYFMAGFFLAFSFFKLINLKSFAESYAMYDVVAKRLPAWGYMYAFLELGLGIAFLLGYNQLLVN